MGNYCMMTTLLDSLEDRFSGEASQREEARVASHLSLFWTPQVSLHELFLYLMSIDIMLI